MSHVESPRISDKQGTLMYSHCLLAKELAIKACKPQGTKRSLVSIPDDVLMSMGQDLSEGGP